MTIHQKPNLFFDPIGDKPPLFFLHIPKTAGSSNNRFLQSIYGRGAFQDHAENLLADLSDGRCPPLCASCISGHIPLWAWHLYPGNEHFKRVTLVRDPWERLVSHVNWVNLFNHGTRPPKHGPGAVDLAVMVDLMQTTDFENRADLIHFFNTANALKYFSSFDNYQTRMLRIGAMDAMEKRLRSADLDVICNALTGFFDFGFCEDQANFQKSLLSKLNLIAQPLNNKTNTGRTKALSPKNDLAREIFAPWIEFDQAFVGFAKGLKTPSSF